MISCLASIQIDKMQGKNLNYIIIHFYNTTIFEI